MKILRVNMNKLEGHYENLPEEWKLVGGRGLIAKIMNKEVPPTADPLGAEKQAHYCGGPIGWNPGSSARKNLGRREEPSHFGD